MKKKADQGKISKENVGQKHGVNMSSKNGGNKSKEDVNGRKEALEKMKVTKKWSVKDDVIAAMKRSANKFSVLVNLDEEIEEDTTTQKQRKVDKYPVMKRRPTEMEKKNWDKEMNEYFTKQWNAMEGKIEEVEEVDNGTAEFITANEYGIKGRNVSKGGCSISVPIC